MIIHVKKWTWYILFIIGIQLLVFCLFLKKSPNEKPQEKSIANPSSFNNRPSFVKQLLLQIFELEFVHKTNIYQVSNTTILQAKKNERNDMYYQS